MRLKSLSICAAVVATLAAQPTRAIPVVDIGAIAQLIEQVNYWKQQIQGMTDQLDQLKTSYAAMTGPRGMEQLLAGSVRNYLPADWERLENALRGAGGGLAGSVRRVSRDNAVLTATQLGGFPVEVREWAQDQRSALALRQVLTRDALSNASRRFQAVQQLIDAIGGATDPKAVMDLQARIGAELGMLQNEQTKLQVLQQMAQADESVRQQREWELAVAGRGRFATRFQPHP